MGTLIVKRMYILGKDGDQRVRWTDEADSQVEARQKFGELLEQAYIAVATDEQGDMVQIFDFDPSAQEITLFEPISGG